MRRRSSWWQRRLSGLRVVQCPTLQPVSSTVVARHRSWPRAVAAAGGPSSSLGAGVRQPRQQRRDGMPDGDGRWRWPSWTLVRPRVGLRKRSQHRGVWGPPDRLGHGPWASPGAWPTAARPHARAIAWQYLQRLCLPLSIAQHSGVLTWCEELLYAPSAG